MKEKKVKESDIQKDIMKYLRGIGIFCWKHNNIGSRTAGGYFIRPSMKGISDIIGCLPDGRMFVIEVKIPGGKASEFQLLFLENIKKNKGLGFIAYSLDDVKSKIYGKNK